MLGRNHAAAQKPGTRSPLCLAPCRYNPDTGVLKLTSERYQDREENRRHVSRMLRDLIQEGRRAHPLAEGDAAQAALPAAAETETAVPAAAEETAAPAAAEEQAAAAAEVAAKPKRGRPRKVAA